MQGYAWTPRKALDGEGPNAGKELLGVAFLPGAFFVEEFMKLTREEIETGEFQAGVDPSLTAGQTVFTQWTQRDPTEPAGFGDSLTDGLGFTIAP